MQGTFLNSVQAQNPFDLCRFAYALPYSKFWSILLHIYIFMEIPEYLEETTGVNFLATYLAYPTVSTQKLLNEFKSLI